MAMFGHSESQVSRSWTQSDWDNTATDSYSISTSTHDFIPTPGDQRPALSLFPFSNPRCPGRACGLLFPRKLGLLSFVPRVEIRAQWRYPRKVTAGVLLAYRSFQLSPGHARSCTAPWDSDIPYRARAIRLGDPEVVCSNRRGLRAYLAGSIIGLSKNCRRDQNA